MQLIDALERVHSLAALGILDDDDEGMASEVERQTEAVATFEDFAVNFWEDVEEDYAEQLATLNAEGAPPLDLDAVRAVASDAPLGQAFAVSLELAAQQFDAETDVLNEKSIDFVGAFWVRHGADIAGRMTAIPLDLGA